MNLLKFDVEVFKINLSDFEDLAQMPKTTLTQRKVDAEILDKRTAPEVARECLDAGLVVNGVTPTSLRLAPPLTISTEELNKGAALLEEVLNSSKGEE